MQDQYYLVADICLSGCHSLCETSWVWYKRCAFVRFVN